MLQLAMATLLLLIPSTACFIGAAYLKLHGDNSLWGWLCFFGFLLLVLPGTLFEKLPK